MRVGTGKYTYEVVQFWGRDAEDRLAGMFPGAATDSRDRVYAFRREPRPAVLVFDRDGGFLGSWGEGVFVQPHGIWIGPDDLLYLADRGDHTVRVCTTDGQVLRTLGVPGRAGAPGTPFDQPSYAVTGPSGCVYVPDHGHDRVYRLATDGTLVVAWGERGQGPGQFYVAHCVWVDPDERVFVADRENHRIQVFDTVGRPLEIWTDVARPFGIYRDGDGVTYVAEGVGRVSLLDPAGRAFVRWGEKGSAPGQFADFLHGIWVDSRGDVYVCAESPGTALQKFARV